MRCARTRAALECRRHECRRRCDAAQKQREEGRRQQFLHRHRRGCVRVCECDALSVVSAECGVCTRPLQRVPLCALLHCTAVYFGAYAHSWVCCKVYE